MDEHIQQLRARMRGPVTSIPVTFTRDGQIDWPGVRNIIETGIAGGSGVSLLTYGDSQFDFLDDQEVAELTGVLVEQVRGRALTVAATKRWWTAKAVDFACYCRQMGVDVLMALPSDHIAGAPGRVAWYKALAREMPLMLVGGISDEILDGLLDEPRVCMWKEDLTLEHIIAAMIKYGDRFLVMSGGMYWRHLPLWPYGCQAFMSWTSCFAPHVARRYWQALQAGDMASVQDIIVHVEAPFVALMPRFHENIQDLWRGALELNGIASRYLRPPRRSLSDAEMEELSGHLRALGLLV